MKLFVLFCVLLANELSFAEESPSSLNNPNHEEELNLIQNNVEELYKALPKNIEEDANLTVPELIVKYTYPMEKHTVEVDGYLLEMHRIPWGRKGPTQIRPPVYLQHGLMGSSADWVITGPDHGLAYILADAGYDVWLPNLRGTTYSRKHKTLDPDRNAKKFWDFTWHDLSVRDVPALIDYIIAQTAEKKIFYVAHSQGTTNFYVMCAEKPEYNDKIRAMVSLAPVGFMGHATSPILKLAAMFEPVFWTVWHLFGRYEFTPSAGLVRSVSHTLCGRDSIMQVLCTNSLFAVVGFNRKEMNATLLPVIMGHTPSATSVKLIRHYAQEMNSRKFRQWDYGFFTNMRKYGNARPPKYNLKAVTAPIYMFYSKNDWVSNHKDVEKLYKKLPNVLGKFLSTESNFNHADYLYSIGAPNLYDKVLSLMSRH